MMSVTPRLLPGAAHTRLLLVGLCTLGLLAEPAPGPTLAPAVLAAGPVGTVVGLIGSDRLIVQGDDGDAFAVQYIGLRGPVRSSAQHEGAAVFHGQLVLGKRVRLAAEGPDEEGGYRLRHAFLEGESTPVGAAVVAAGWARAVPYPPVHQHTERYRALERQAMESQLNLWQPGLLGPASGWAPAGRGGSAYLSADPALHDSLDLLQSVPTGRAVLDALAELGPVVLARDLPEGVGGYFSPLGYQIAVSRNVLQAADRRSAAAVLAHEGAHALEYAAAAAGSPELTCLQLEQRAHATHAQVWAEYYGPGGKPQPQDNWDRYSNEILRFAARNDLENYVTRSAAYELQCASERGVPRP